jgi:acetyl-CoA C-acetyltransferase
MHKERIMKEAVIIGAARTPIGSFGGALASVPAPRLGAAAIQAALERAGITGDLVDEVIMGCVLPAGLGQAPARQAAIFAGLPQGVPCLTINKVCGSGLKAVMLAAQAIRSGDATVVVAGGMENMSQAPYLLPDARDGMRMGHKRSSTRMVKDGLWDVYNDFHMGNAGEICARDCGITARGAGRLRHPQL